MLPPVSGVIPADDDPGSPCAPYPETMLVLGNYRWLSQAGAIRGVPDAHRALFVQARDEAIAIGLDPQVEVGGSLYTDIPVYVTARTLAYWQGAAQRAGYTLEDLMV